ncbi:MAG TPA: AbrB/MazE/SpoVT family DNA-binding domain-containing protein [Bdellovibrionota bacterium]|nr:AbrB/MazE/SpoVT family DNA-binding domain-containing protein [Bdellovibrionota bacterium]
MKKKLIKIGNSFGITLEKPILQLLKITPKTELDVVTDGHRLIIEPSHKFKEAVRRTSEKYSLTFKKLAK